MNGSRRPSWLIAVFCAALQQARAWDDTAHMIQYATVMTNVSKETPTAKEAHWQQQGSYTLVGIGSCWDADNTHAGGWQRLYPGNNNPETCNAECVRVYGADCAGFDARPIQQCIIYTLAGDAANRITHTKNCNENGNLPGCDYFVADCYRHETAAPTPSPTAGANGDPHCRNVKGESFDIHTTGWMTMLQVPGFRITANIGRIYNHDSCSPTVIKEVTVGGDWLGRGDEEMTVVPGDNGMPFVPETWMKYFESQSAPHVSLELVATGKSINSELISVRMKVFQTVILLIQHRGTRSGVDYFDMRVNHISALGKDVGGLLGNDPHDVESAPSLQCLNVTTAARLGAVSGERGSTGRGMMSLAWVE